MKNIDVSVIVPMYNATEYISKTLFSIINQDFGNYEVILINDGSTDDTLEKSFEIISKSNIPFKIFSQKNKGASIARNIGIKNAKGEFILFVDCDDYISENYISSLYNACILNKTDFALSKLIKVDENENKLTKLEEYDIINNKNKITTLNLVKLELTMKIPFSFVQILYKSSILKENNIKFNENLVYGEDTEFALKSLIHGKEIAIAENSSYFYLKHINSAISNVSLNRFCFINTLENIISYYEKENGKYSKEELNDIIYLIKTNRIPKAIFGNMLYFFYNDYSYLEVIEKMKKLNLFSKLSNFKVNSFKDFLFLFKSKVFLISPLIYYKLWKTFKNNIS